MNTKICIKCENEKDLIEFSFRRDTQKHRNECKECRIIYFNKYRENNLEKLRDQQREYYLTNSERIKLRKEEYRKLNKDHINEYFRKRKASDPNFKIACNIRSRTSDAFKSQNLKKNNKTFELLGCSHNFFKSWIEFQLIGNMSMENYGLVWHIDHTLPCSSFNLLNENDMKKCFNWVNLRPMYASENISKGNKIDERLYLLQEIKACYFEKLNEERYH